MTKILLIGLGRWGRNHLRNLRALGAEVFVAESDPERLAFAGEAGVPADHLAAGHREFLTLVAAAVIVTPAPTHFTLARECLLAGLDVFVEKPMTLLPEEARELADLAARTGRVLQVGHIFRHDPAVQWLHGALAAGRFGAVRLLRAHFCEFKRPRADSGLLFADVVHFVDLFHYLLGRAPARVLAVTQDFLGQGQDDALLVSLEYPSASGTIWATIEMNCFFPGKVRDLLVVGSAGTVRCDLNNAPDRLVLFGHRHESTTNGIRAVPGDRQVVTVPPDEPLRAELAAFLASLVTRHPAGADAQAGCESIRVLTAAAESARTRRSVELSPAG